MTLANFSIKQQKLDAITLMNLKQTLHNFEFSEEITLKCIDDEDIDCLVIIDGTIQEEKIKGLFKKCPDVYEYSKDQTRLEFDSIEIKHLEVLPVCFEFKLQKNGHSSQMIVDVDDEVFIYDNISKHPHKIKYINDISYFFDDKIREVKDAF
jgi:hypothetical protein